MIYRLSLMLGAVSLATALVFGTALLWHGSQARALGSFTQGFSSNACQHPIDRISPQQLVMSKNDTQSIQVNLLNKGKSTCKFTVKLDAPNFQPSSGAKAVSLAAEERSSVIWLLAPPDKLGDFKIKVTAALDQATVGIRVTSVLGLSAAQAELLTLLGTIIGGSGITIPWLHSIYAKRRRGRSAAYEDEHARQS